jgi:hypothetical protein
MPSSLKSVALLLLCSVSAGCASQAYRPPDGQQTTVIQFMARFVSDRSGSDSAQILAFRDASSCGKHPRGTYMGVLCPACGGLSLSQPVETAIPITLKYEYVFGGITTNHGRCNNQFTLTPQQGIKYRAILEVTQERCGTVVQSSSDGTNWSKDQSVSYDDKLCTWW